MSFFKRDNTDERRPIGSLTSGENADAQIAKAEVDRIAAELKSSADQQAQAARRIAGLNKSLEKMESGLRQSSRIEADNMRLSAELADLKTKLEQKTSWASEQENKLINLERSHNEMRQQYEAAKADIAQRTDRETETREKLFKQSREVETLSTQLAQKNERLAAVTATNQGIQDDLAQQAADLSAQKHTIVSLRKSVEELSARLEAKTKEVDGSAVETKNLRMDLTDMKARYFEANSALENAKYNNNTQKKVFEETLKRRDNENLALERRIEQLNTQLRIKDNMSNHFDEEIVSLRNTLKTERERNDRNEERFRNKMEEVERNARSLARTKAEYEELSAKYAAASEDLESLRKITLVQKQKLERYAAIGGVSVGQALHSAGVTEDGPRLKAVK
ncbi:hypothetical protein ACJ3XI_07775 [Litorimonas sp. RW-G-Af-16]|uniref:hypothetical protein n=1 Tax=Litorimonas sp. RW-G-Af-16 TaxID=3241168 RepID=UPI00390C86EC